MENLREFVESMDIDVRAKVILLNKYADNDETWYRNVVVSIDNPAFIVINDDTWVCATEDELPMYLYDCVAGDLHQAMEDTHHIYDYLLNTVDIEEAAEHCDISDFYPVEEVDEYDNTFYIWEC